MPQVDAKIKVGMELISESLEAEAKQKAKKAGETVQKELNKGTKKITFGQKIKGEFQKIKKGIQAVGISGDKLGKIGEFLSAGGKLGALAAGFAILGKQISDMWDRATLSAEEYAKKQELRLKDSAEKVQKTQQRHNEDNNYFQRLVELAKVEQMSLQQKEEAIQIIEILNKRYANLGLTIDSVTGSILGLANAHAKMSAEQKKEMLENLRGQVKDIQSLAHLRMTKAFVQLNKAWGSGYIDEIMFNHFGMVKGGVNDSLSYMQELSTEQQIKVLTFLRDKNAKTDAEIDRLQVVIDLKKKQLDLERRIAKIKNQPSTSGSIPKNTDVDKKKVKELIAQREKYNQQAFNLQDAKTDMRKAESFRKLKTDSEKIEWFNTEIQVKTGLIKSYNQEIAKLQGKTYTANQTMEQLKDQTKIAQLKMLIAKADKEILGCQIEIKKIQDLSAKFYQDEKDALELQLEISKLKLQGKFDEIELLKLQNKLKKDGLIIDEKEIKAILQKKKQLASWGVDLSLKNQADSIYEKVSGNDRNYQIQKRIRDLEQANGVSLTDYQKKDVETLFDLEEKLKKISKFKLDLSGMDIKTNDLTARGGFQTGAVLPDIVSINKSIRDYSAKTSQTINEIKNILKNGWKF